MIDVGDTARIFFLDHSQEHDGVVECSVYGQVLEVNQTFVRIAGWYTHDIDASEFDAPHVTWNILKSTILSSYRLKQQREEFA